MAEVLTKKLEHLLNSKRSIYPVLPTIKECKTQSVKLEVSEFLIDCQRINLIDQQPNIKKLTNFHSFHSVNIIDDQQFPSIDNSDNNSDVINGNNGTFKIVKKSPLTAKEWKREKTYDGSPVYRVIFFYTIYF